MGLVGGQVLLRHGGGWQLKVPGAAPSGRSEGAGTVGLEVFVERVFEHKHHFPHIAPVPAHGTLAVLV